MTFKRAAVAVEPLAAGGGAAEGLVPGLALVRTARARPLLCVAAGAPLRADGRRHRSRRRRTTRAPWRSPSRSWAHQHPPAHPHPRRRPEARRHPRPRPRPRRRLRCRPVPPGQAAASPRLPPTTAAEYTTGPKSPCASAGGRPRCGRGKPPARCRRSA
eukprot:scaffold921_cov101-Isochrysis_galbana.AAC.13